MGAASADVPAIMITGGPAEPALFRGRELGAGTDLWHYADDVRAGRMTQAEFDELEAAKRAVASATATRWAPPRRWPSLVEALGMSLPGTAAIPACDARARDAAEATGRRAVELAREGPAPVADRHRRGARQRDHAADGAGRRHERGRPPARARRPRGRRPLASTASTSSRAARRCSRTCGRRGEHLFEDLYRAGGVPARAARAGAAAAQRRADRDRPHARRGDRRGAAATNRDVIARARRAALATEGGIAVLRGIARPGGALIKLSAASPELFSPPRPGGRLRGRLRPGRAHRRPGST